MFLPRPTFFQTNHRPSLRRDGSSASTVSLQVHETILAAKARDLSTVCGLGLADEDDGSVRNQDRLSRKRSDEPHRQILSAKQNVGHLFVGGPPNRRAPPSLAQTEKRPSKKRTSLRGYAQARWTRHNHLCERVLGATDVDKLEWEAKAALLHHSYPLAILLLWRAASLGSAAACQQLGSLYADGVSRGTSPAVTLVYRDTLRSVAWILEALRLYEPCLAARIRAANSSSTSALHLAQLWRPPLHATQLLVQCLLSPNVAAFDPCQKNAVFLPVVDDLVDSQCVWLSGPSRNSNRSVLQATELWIEVEDAVRRWSVRLEAETSVDAFQMHVQHGPDDLEELQSLATTMRDLDYHLRVLRAIQVTRSLALEPYAEYVDQVETAWIQALAVRSREVPECLDPSKVLDVLSRAKGRSGRLYDETLFRDLQTCTQTNARRSLAIDYHSRRPKLHLRASRGASQSKDRTHLPHAATQTRDRLRDLPPADVETTKQMEEHGRPALTMRISSCYASAQAAVVSVSASGEHPNSTADGVSASRSVRQKYGRAVSSSSFGSSSATVDLRATEPSSPTDSVRTKASLGIGRPRRPSSVVSITPSLLFPAERARNEQRAPQDYFTNASSRRPRSSSSSFFTPNGGMPRPRVTSLYSSAPVVVSSESATSLMASSASTSGQSNLHALAFADSTFIPTPSRPWTGSTASTDSLRPRISSDLPKTSCSISKATEASVSFGSTSTTRIKSDSFSSSKPSAAAHSAAADTLRRLKARRSHNDLRTSPSVRKDLQSGPPAPPVPATVAHQPGTETPRVSLLRPSRSTVFISVENLPNEGRGDISSSTTKMPENGGASANSAMEHLSRTQARISHQSIPSVFEDSEFKPSNVSAATTGPPFASALAAGALSGLTVDLLFFPIDTIKTRLQSAQGFWAAGGFSGVYRGLASTAVGSAPGAAVFFTTYESMKPALVRWAPSVFGADGALGPAGVHMAAASIAETAACLIRVPTEVIKSRQQTMTYGKGTTTFQAFKKVFQEAGIRGYYRGFGSTVGREIPFTCIQFPLYEKLKLEMARSRARSQAAAADVLGSSNDLAQLSDQELVRNLPTWQAGLAGSIAGAIAAGLTTPLDVVKTRIMLHTKQAVAAAPGAAAAAATLPRGVNTDIIPTLLHVGRTEGVKTLFSGFLPRTMWIGLGGAVFLGTFDAGIKTLS